MKLPLSKLFNPEIKPRVFTFSAFSQSTTGAAISNHDLLYYPVVNFHRILFPKLNPAAPECMREKRLVTFWMAPKKSSGRGKRKEAAIAEPTMADGWKKSKLPESDIASLVDERLLQSRAIIQW